MNLSNSEKPDKPIGSSGFSAEMKHICSYQQIGETRIWPLEKTGEGLDSNIVPAVQPEVVG